MFSGAGKILSLAFFGAAGVVLVLARPAEALGVELIFAALRTEAECDEGEFVGACEGAVFAQAGQAHGLAGWLAFPALFALGVLPVLKLGAAAGASGVRFVSHWGFLKGRIFLPFAARFLSGGFGAGCGR